MMNSSPSRRRPNRPEPHSSASLGSRHAHDLFLRRRAPGAIESGQGADQDVEAYVRTLVAHGYAEEEARPYAVAYFQRIKHP